MRFIPSTIFSGLFICLIIISTSTLVHARNRKWCGADLRNMLRLLCGSKYNSNVPGKEDPTQSKDTEHQMSITQECCERSCSFTTLRSYCASPESPPLPIAVPIADTAQAEDSAPQPKESGPLPTTTSPKPLVHRGPSRYETVYRKHSFDISPLLESSLYE